MLYNRKLTIPPNSLKSFFLWGPRQSGKTSLLKALFPDAYRVDLLNSERFIEFSREPHRLREELLALNSKTQLVIIDEVQKIPALLDEVHWLIENVGYRFGLCGSSARKLKRGHANLLGGRAVRYELSGLVSEELGSDFDLLRIINRGYIPNHYLDDDYRTLIRSYVTDYLKEEIFAESLVRSLPAFSRFLEVCAICDTNIINYRKTAEDCDVSPPTVKEYYQILVDTLLGSYLEAYSKKAKRKIVKSPKFYMFDVGIVNFLSRKESVLDGSNEFGPCLENFLYHEVSTCNKYLGKYAPLSYWRLADSESMEVDFIIGDMEIAIECKATARATGSHFKSLYEIKKEQPALKRRILVCLESRKRKLDDGIEIYPVKDFLEELWGGGVIP
ncbi:MAG TPA: AAA family ATPase [Oligoflexia bacterium]|nr:AAA family ATPase [Oligoflexia bacterium]HMP48298.1 AAA family ATPase [Oligoflexia bacterium]